MRQPTFITLVCILLITACSDYPVTTELVTHVAGTAGKQTPIERDTEGNIFGYYEYLPQSFDKNSSTLHPVIIYWNGQNAIAGNGRDELPGNLTQGLPEYINQGRHYPAIIISAQTIYGDWKTIDTHPFVKYILARYSKHIDTKKIYMSGFSAGGGLTMRYAMENPDILAAIVPIAPAIRYPTENDPTTGFANTPSWIFHNKGDDVVNADRSTRWQAVIKDNGADHRLTIYDVDNHYAWQAAYSDSNLWEWLFKQSK